MFKREFLVPIFLHFLFETWCCCCVLFLAVIYCQGEQDYVQSAVVSRLGVFCYLRDTQLGS